MTDRSTLHGSNTFLATIPASLGANRWAVAICIASFVGFCGLIPFAGIQLPRIEAFIPIYESTFALNYLVTAGAMFVGFRRSHVRAVLVLGSGYLFTSLMAVAHLLTFPVYFRAAICSVSATKPTPGWIHFDMRPFRYLRFVTPY